MEYKSNIQEDSNYIKLLEKNVGIGTTVPLVGLDVRGTAIITNQSGGNYNENLRLPQNPSGFAVITLGGAIAASGSNASQWSLLRNPSNSFEIRRQDTAYALINSSGNVGIGTTSPGYKLDVNGNIRGTGTSQLNHLNCISTLSFGSFTTGVQGTLFEGYSTHSVVRTDSARLDFYMGKTTTGVGTMMSLTDTGNVGIGTTVPTARLSLGAASQGHRITWENYSNVFSEYSSGDLWLSSNFYGNLGSSGYVTSNTASFGAAGISVSGTGGGLNGVIKFFVDDAAAKTAGTAFVPSERMRITGSGNVGIGTTNPTRPLHVVGGDSGSGTHIAQFQGNFGVVGMYIRGDGNVGIGTSSPSSKLEVAGNVSIGTTTVAPTNGLLVQGNASIGGSVFGESLLFTNPSTNVFHKVATLPSTNSGTYDSIVIEGVINTGWGASTSIPFKMLFGNRNGNSNQYFFGPNNQSINIEVYLESNNSRTVWVKCNSNSFSYITINVISSINVTNFPDFPVGTPTGTLNWTSNSNTPTTYYDMSNNRLGIKTTTPGYDLDVTGTIRATGDVIAFSDVRLKENINTIENALDKVIQLRGVEYNKIGEEEKSIGVIAQEVEKILPQVVKEDENGMKSVAYGNIVGVLIEAIKEQQKQIDELKMKIDGITG